LCSSLLKELTESAGDIRFGEVQEVELTGLAGVNLVYPVRRELRISQQRGRFLPPSHTIVTIVAFPVFRRADVRCMDTFTARGDRMRSINNLEPGTFIG